VIKITVQIDGHEPAEQIRIEIGVQVQNAAELVARHKGALAGWAAGLLVERRKLQALVEQQILEQIARGLHERLAESLVQGLADPLRETLATELRRQGVQAELRILARRETHEAAAEAGPPATEGERSERTRGARA
jgi:hypothetical protein